MWTLGPVAEGLRINVTFLHFDLEDDSECWNDQVEIDYKTVHCGHIAKPWSVVSNSNVMTLRFRSNYEENFTGFLGIWSPTAEPPTFKSKFGSGCENCEFPFLFQERKYESCANIDGDDKAWCLNQIIPPSLEGTHKSLAPPSKVPCSDTDSSCHRTPSISTHPNNQPGNCCRFCR